MEEKKALSALRCSGPPRARGSAYRCKRRFHLAFGHAMLFCEVGTAVPWRMVPTASGWLPHGAASLFAAAGRWLMIVSAWASAIAPMPARAARSEAERAERGSGQMRPCTPTQNAPRRGNQLPSLCGTPPRPSGSHRKPAGTISRRPPYSAEARRCRSASKGVFSLWTVHGPFLFWQDQKRNGGCIAQLST